MRAATRIEAQLPLVRVRLPMLGLVLGLVLALALAVFIIWMRSGGQAPGTDLTRVSQAVLEETVGVRIVRVAATGAGGLLDLRYQVVDPDKALAVHDQSSPAAIVDEESGRVLNRVFHAHH